ncbi:phospho-acceptor domain-containing protein [Geothermobacter ehrlichii]|uniref:histidine kinase n=1 Tax=Geothermobacter ehrlichii TaxID=213224 RepID=A0A5D3WP96_9BACT|nr:ATP-binding protein [Geothermobacter ehrlichii]TYP00164.1 phospho-acceptor domain-containing protein [Geothermobacter ehrlichii]
MIIRNHTHSDESAVSGTVEKDWTYAEVLRNLDMGILILDPQQRRMLFANPALGKILPDLGDAPSFNTVAGFFPGIDDASRHGAKPGTINHGRQILGYTIYPVAEKHLCLLVRDITRKTRLESIAQAVNTMDNLGFIFSGIRHEIGNPLNSIKMTASVLRKNLDHFSRENITEYIDRIYHEILRMEYLLKSLKSFSMFEKVDNRPQPLKEFIVHFSSLIRRDLEAKNIRLLTVLPPKEILVLMDPQALHHALLNIVTNAADALAGRPSPCIRIEAQGNGSLAWLTVEDNGCGMNEEQLTQLFQPFCTSKPEGNGLGLVITQKLLAKMNGSLEITSREGIGTRAVIALPLHDRNEPSTLPAHDMETSGLT